MHTRLPKDFPPLENFRGARWRESVLKKLASKCTHDELTLFWDSHERVCRFENSTLPAGNIHGDLFHDNALFRSGMLSGVIDFYYAHRAPYIYDLAVTIADWCFVQNNGELHRENAISMLRAYASVRGLSTPESQAWPTAIELASLRFLLSRLHDQYYPRAGSLTQQKDPKVFKELLHLSRDMPKVFAGLLN